MPAHLHTGDRQTTSSVSHWLDAWRGKLGLSFFPSQPGEHEEHGEHEERERLLANQGRS